MTLRNLTITLLLATTLCSAATLESEFARLAATIPARVGVCALAGNTQTPICLNPDQRFPMQSVMKLLVGLATLDAIDHHRFGLDDPILIHQADLSLYMQPIAKLVTPAGYKTTIGDLIRRANVDSDCAAADILLSKIGGPPAVQAFLTSRHITGIRLDRDERHLQTEIVGIAWRPEFVDAPALERAIAAVPAPQRTAAYKRYQSDPRDTSTPTGMVSLLDALTRGKLLSHAATAWLLAVLHQTATGPDRLKAGLAPGWSIAHKTGTSGKWQGVTAATNDVGILTGPHGETISIAVFIADSPAPDSDRARVIAQLAGAAIRYTSTP